MHGGQVGAAVQAGEVGGGAGVALGVGRRLAVAHGVGGGPLHAGGRGGQRVGQGGDGRAPDGHGRVSIAGARDQAGPCLGGGGAVGARGVRAGIRGADFLQGRGLLLGGPRLGLATALLQLLAALGTTVLKPNLEEQRKR